jgi:hypothetical protein
MAAIRRNGKPYIYVTWLAKLLGGHECTWSAWFKAHYKYDKYETYAQDLQAWNRDHSDLMQKRRAELEREGFTVTVEEANAFKLEGQVAVVAGKPDLIAHKPGLVLLVDGKTGRERESDIWQVLLYLFALPKTRPQLTEGAVVEGEVQYKRGGTRISVTPGELDEPRKARLLALIGEVAGAQAPPRRPSAHECRVCNIGPADCPQRIRPAREQTTTVEDF